jgi:hypothetical protein
VVIMAEDEQKPKRREKPDVEDFENPRAGKTTLRKGLDADDVKKK